MEKHDKLDQIFEKQENLMVKLEVAGRDENGNLILPSGSSLIYWILVMTRAIIHEVVAEIERMLPWKPWELDKKNDSFDKEHMKEEFIDVAHFLIESMILLGVTSEEFYRLYVDKNKTNHKRAEEEFVPFTQK